MAGGSNCLQVKRASTWVSPSARANLRSSFYARACVTKRKGDKRRQYAINGSFASAVAAAIAIADAEASPIGPDSPEGDRKPRTCALPAPRHLP